jgi:vacuolar protein sorting-associated protein 1
MGTRYDVTARGCYVVNVLLSEMQAMQIVNDRMNANKPPPQNDPKKLPPGTLNNNKDLEVDARKEEPSFFGTFFSSAAKSAAAKKKGAAAMEAVCTVYLELWSAADADDATI